MGLLDFFSSKKKVNTLNPILPTSSQVAIQKGIVTWQGANSQEYVRLG